MSSTFAPAACLAPAACQKGENACFGVLYTGYLLKANPGAYVHYTPKRRFVVLTHVALHWFKREEGYDLFGEERGYALIQDIVRVEAVEGPDKPTNHTFQIILSDSSRRTFEAGSAEEMCRWMTAINCAIKNRYCHKKDELTGLSFIYRENNSKPLQPMVLVLSVQHADGHETILHRHVPYQQPTTIHDLQADDRLMFTLSNGCVASVNVQDLRSSSPTDEFYNVPVEGGILSVSLLCTAQLSSPPRGRPKSAGPMDYVSALQAILPVVLSCLLVLASVALPTSTPWRWYADPYRIIVLVLSTVLAGLLAHESGLLRVWAKDLKKRKMGPLTLEIKEYAIQVSEAPKGEDDSHNLPPIPERFITGCFGDMNEAMRRWKATLNWRMSFGTDTILDQPHPYFDLIKQCYPHYFCGVARDGSPVYIERSGQIDPVRLRQAGVTVDKLVWHYIYLTEFLYKELHPSEQAKTLTIFDVQGVSLRDLSGEPFEFVRKATQLVQEHYPERARAILVVNTPGWFSMMWKMIRPLVNEATQKKIRIVKAGKDTYECLREFIAPENIPAEYGGKLRYGDEADSCRWKSPGEVKFRDHVHAINKLHEVESKW